MPPTRTSLTDSPVTDLIPRTRTAKGNCQTLGAVQACLATWALRSVLVRAPALGLRKVLVTCGDSNLASARVIEKAGGVLEDVRDTELGLTRRYWITP
jgi:hypothetical protein